MSASVWQVPRSSAWQRAARAAPRTPIYLYTFHSFHPVRARDHEMSNNPRTQKRLDWFLQTILYACSQSIVHFKFSWPILPVIPTGTALLLAWIKTQSISAGHLRSPAQPQIFAELSVERRRPIRPVLPTKLKMQKNGHNYFWPAGFQEIL